jgi:hypothetical protein
MLAEISVGRQEDLDDKWIEKALSGLPSSGELLDNDDLVVTKSHDPVEIPATSITKPAYLDHVRRRKAREAGEKATRDEAQRLKSIEGHFKQSKYRPDAAHDADEVFEVSLFPPAVRKMHPSMFRSPNRNDWADFIIWTETGDYRKVLAAQCERGRWNRALEQKLTVEAEKRHAAISSITEADLDEAHARLGAWIAEGDTQVKIQNRGKEDELMLLWRAWTISARRLGREPRPGEFGQDVEAIGGSSFVATRKATRVRFDKMKAFHAPDGPWAA